MKKLPSNFTINRFGMFARFVEEEDAQFIIKLRTNEHARYMNDVSSDLEEQIAWIKHYKEREKKGEDYYFIFFKDDIPIGLNRIYDMHEGVFSTGSWTFAQDAPFGTAFLAQVVCRDIAFYDLGLEREEVATGVHVENVNVTRYNLMVGMKEIGRVMTDKGEYISVGLSKEDYEKGKKKIFKMTGIKI